VDVIFAIFRGEIACSKNGGGIFAGRYAVGFVLHVFLMSADQVSDPSSLHNGKKT